MKTLNELKEKELLRISKKIKQSKRLETKKKWKRLYDLVASM